MNAATALLAYVIVERLVELVIDRRHSAALLAEGAHEVGAGHYPVMVAMHVVWLIAIAAWVFFGAPALNAVFAVLYVLVQPLRFWVMASLGRYWTTRIITVPKAPLVKAGAYRFLRHPNYVVVTLEVALLPLALDAWPIAAVFTILNALMLRHRIRVENMALATRG